MPDVVGVDTLLSGDLPESAANYSSLAAHAAKTAEDWEDEYRGAEETRWGDGVLGGLYSGLAQGKPFVAALIEAIVEEIFEGISGVADNVEDAFLALSENFSGKWRDIIAAKDAADYANAQLAVSLRPIKDLFDGAAGNLSSTLWDVSYIGSFAAGTVQQDGNGNAWWNGSGFAPRTARCRYKDLDTTGDRQLITVVMPQPVQAPAPLGTQSHLRLLGRVNTAVDDFVYAEITDGGVELGCAVAGVGTVFATVGTATQKGDVWDFLVGDPATSNDYLFTLKRNGVEILAYDDVAMVSQMDGSHRSVGFEMEAASRGLSGQTSPGTLAVFSADDN